MGEQKTSFNVQNGGGVVKHEQEIRCAPPGLRGLNAVARLRSSEIGEESRRANGPQLKTLSALHF